MQQLPMSLAPPSSRPIRAYSDKELWIDVSEIAVGTGLRGKTAVSMTLSEALTPRTTELDGNFDQRLWDALWLAHLKLYVDQVSSATFCFSYARTGTKTGEITEVCFRLHVEEQDGLTQLGLAEDF